MSIETITARIEALPNLAAYRARDLVKMRKRWRRPAGI
jgi:hypothetical protein